MEPMKIEPFKIKPFKIGSAVLKNSLVLGPMAGVTDLPFRLLCRQKGAGLVCMEMISAKAIYYNNRNTEELMEIHPDEGPVSLQLFGSDPVIISEMAKRIEERPFSILDINMGCPVPNVFKSGEGSALMLDQPRAAAIIRGCKKSGKIVTVKCRTGIRKEDMFAAEFARVCEDAGADMITIHGRSRSMMYDGDCCYEEIARAKAAVSIPVIANGGIFSAEEADRMMERTGADGVMIARYALENPFIFSELTGKYAGKSTLQLILEQMEMTLTYYDETFTMAYIRKLASYGMKKRKGTKKYKEQLYRSGSMKELRELSYGYFHDDGGFVLC